MMTSIGTAASGPLFLFPESKVTGRLAPSPTGQLHLGNAWAFLLAWLSARSAGGKVILRIDDIDTARSRSEFALNLVDDLEWLGLDWDVGPGTESPARCYVQSARGDIYREAIDKLASRGLLYPCFCSRRELKNLPSAPHAEEPCYPGICAGLDEQQRLALLGSGKAHSLRFRCPGGTVRFRDALLGDREFLPEQFGGDFPVVRGDGVVSYQLATAVDDSLMGVTQVVRGRDLLSSTPRQILIQKALELSVPAYAHIPLLLDQNGERLAKRHGALSLANLRQNGARPQMLTGALAHAAGMLDKPEPISPRELLANFDLAQLSPRDRQLRGGTDIQFLA